MIWILKLFKLLIILIERERDRVDMNCEFLCYVCVLEDWVLWGNY